MIALAFSLAGLAAALSAAGAALRGRALVARRDAASTARGRLLACIAVPVGVSAIGLCLAGVTLSVAS